jgi:hypothetical protein
MENEMFALLGEEFKFLLQEFTNFLSKLIIYYELNKNQDSGSSTGSSIASSSTSSGSANDSKGLILRIFYLSKFLEKNWVKHTVINNNGFKNSSQFNQTNTAAAATTATISSINIGGQNQTNLGEYNNNNNTAGGGINSHKN